MKERERERASRQSFCACQISEVRLTQSMDGNFSKVDQINIKKKSTI